jgi:WD40 repeat protein
LKARLARRGLALPAGIALPLIPAALSASLPAASPIVTPQLIASVTQAAVRFSTDSLATDLSSPAAELARKGLRVLLLSKGQLAAAVVLTITIIVAGAGLLGRQMLQVRGVALAPRDEDALGEQTQPRSPDPKPASEKPQVRLDRFGDPLPEGVVSRLGTSRFRHGAEVRSVAFAPDRKTLASGGQDNAVRLWDIATGKELRRFTAVTGLGAEHAWVSSIAYSPDGKFLAAGTLNGPGEVVVWELATGKESRPRHMNRPGVVCLAYSQDNKVLAAGTQDGLVHLWDADTLKPIRQLKGHQNLIEALAFTADSKTLASASRDKTIRLWDVATGRELRQCQGHTDMVLAVAFPRDGNTLASGSWDNTIRIWDTSTGKELHVLKGHAMAVSTLAFLPDDKTLASGSWDGSIRLWDTAAGKALRQMSGYTRPIPSIAVSKDGKTLASGSWDRLIRFWDVDKGEECQPTQGNKSGLWSAAISPNGKRVVTGGEEGVVRIWDASSGKEICHLHLEAPHGRLPVSEGTLRVTLGDRLHFAADSKTLSVSSEFTLGRWEAETGRQIKLKPYPLAQNLYPTPDDKFVIGRDGEGNFVLIDATTGKKIRQFKASQRSFVFTISPDGKFLACGSPEENGTVIIWELVTGKERCRCKGTPHIAYGLTFSPDGKYLAGTTHNMQFFYPESPIYVWDAATGQKVRQFQASGHSVTCLAYSSDGRMLASGGGDKTIRLWETATGKERYCFVGHQGIIRSVAFSQDGIRLVSASDDTTALVWETTAPTHAGIPTAKQLHEAWSDLASDDATKANRAIWLLTRNAEQSIPLLREHMPPARALDDQTRKQVEHWLTDLDSSEAAVRARASGELEKRVVMAEPILRTALTGQPSLEQRKRIERVLEHLERERVKLGRALEALERAQTPESRQLLEALAAGEPKAWLTQGAKAVLTRQDGSVSNPR